MLATWGCTTFPKPTLSLDFLGATSLDSGITFTRASTATYFNSAGVLTTANNNVARFDYNPSTLAPRGLLIEEQRTNSILQSEDFATTWVTTAATVTANAIVAPSGATTGDKMIVDSGVSSGSSSLRQEVTKAASAIALTLSMFAKKDEADTLRMLPRDTATSANNVDARFNLDDGTVISVTAAGTFTNASAAIQNVGNGWYRCSVTFTSGTETSIRSQIFQQKAAGNFTGNGTDGIYIWGYQFEVGAFATSYIPTTTTALTRNADVASMTGTNFSSWYNQSEGTLFANWTSFIPNGTSPGSTYSAGFTDNLSSSSAVQLVIQNRAVSNQIRVWQSTTGGGLDNFIAPAITTFQGKAVAVYGGGLNVSASANGGAVVTMADPITATSFTTLALGLSTTAVTGSGANYLNGHIQRIAYYPTRLPDATLQALTA